MPLVQNITDDRTRGERLSQTTSRCTLGTAQRKGCGVFVQR
ncbi:hypothetical protein K788_0007317 [Paraburkholderia caribensis MBA4]|uniref:Uncharacterized protein n=1 Tax=Paraburkholderia caribensis MBA4 TaxID=1323664 RepID=A0A0N7JVI2_9BURK|nr:hypothetical protein K788_0007317 [Paraburkholderia caribensis MBA4]